MRDLVRSKQQEQRRQGPKQGSLATEADRELEQPLLLASHVSRCVLQVDSVRHSVPLPPPAARGHHLVPPGGTTWCRQEALQARETDTAFSRRGCCLSASLSLWRLSTDASAGGIRM